MRAIFTRDFTLAFIAYFLAGLAFCGYLHMPGHLVALGASEGTIGVVVAVSTLFSTVLRPSIGRLADRHGRRPLLRAGSVLGVMTCALYVTLEAIDWRLYAMRVVHGIASAVIFSVFFTYAADIVPARRRTQGLALFGVAGMSPLALGGLLGDVIVPRHGYRALYATLLGIQVASLAVAFTLRESRPDEPPPRDRALDLLRRTELVPLWLLIFGFEVAATTYFTFMRTFVDAVGTGSVGLFFSCYSGAAIALRVLFGWLPDRLGPRRTLIPSLALSLLGYVLLAHANTAVEIGAAGVLTGSGHGFVYPIVAALVVARVGSNERGTSLSLYTAVYEAGLLLGSPLVGFVLERFGYPVMFWVAALVLAFSAAAFGALDRVRRAVPAAPA